MFKDYDSGDRILLKLLICLGVLYGTVIGMGLFALVLVVLHVMGVIK